MSPTAEFVAVVGELVLEARRDRCALFTREVTSIDEVVTFQTTNPSGRAIGAIATGNGELTATLTGGRIMICPPVNAVPTRDASEQRAAQIPAVTVGIPLSAGRDVVTGLVGN